MSKQFANQFSTEIVLRSTGAGATAAMAFVDPVQAIRIRNYAAVPIHVNLASTAAASTDDPELEADSVLRLDGIRVSGLGLRTTSTTSSTGADGHRVVVSAWGGY